MLKRLEILLNCCTHLTIYHYLIRTFHFFNFRTVKNMALKILENLHGQVNGIRYLRFLINNIWRSKLLFLCYSNRATTVFPNGKFDGSRARHSDTTIISPRKQSHCFRKSKTLEKFWSGFDNENNRPQIGALFERLTSCYALFC